MFGYPWQGVRDPLAIPSGALRQQVQIQNQSQTRDAYNAPLTTWTTIFTTWAAISTMSSREVYQAAQFTSQVTHRVTIRWPGASVSIGIGQRVLFGELVYIIQAVENVQQRNRVLNLMCLELNGDA